MSATPPGGVDAGRERREATRNIGPLLLTYGAAGWAWSLLSEWLMAMVVDDVHLMTLYGTLKDWGWITLSLLVLYHVMRRGAAPGAAGALTHGELRPLVRRAYAAWVLVVCTALVAGLAALVHGEQRSQQQRLEAIAQSRALAVSDYLRQLKSYGRFMSNSSAMSSLWMRWQSGGDESSGEALKARMMEFREAAGYRSVTLVDPTGRIV